MSTALAAENRKLRATRSTGLAAMAVLALGAALAVANVLLAGTGQNAPLDEDAFQHIVRAPTGVLGFAMLLLGVLTAAGEYRHGTIVTTLLAQPHRGRVAMAKLSAVGLAGALLAVATAAVSAAVGLPLLAGQDAPAIDWGPVPTGLLVLVATGVLYGAVGVGLGLLLRNQAAALTLALLWWFVMERIVPVVLGEPQAIKWLPGGAATAFAGLGDGSGAGPDGLLPPWQGGLLLTAYAVAIAALAVVVLRRRDQT